MGCCISTTKRDPDHQNASPPKSHNKSHVNSYPPPSLEEETVKEVLSETPISKPDKNTQKICTTTSTIQEEEKVEKVEDFINKEEEISEITQVSETYSLTESFSTTTTTIREDEATSKQSREVSHRVSRAPAKVPRKRPHSGDLTAGGGRERGPKSPAGQRNVGSTGVRRDFREGSGRRSRSPATRTSGGVGRGRGRGGGGGRELKVTGTAGGRLDVEEVNEGVLQQHQGNESLENPLVSLECFIFL